MDHPRYIGTIILTDTQEEADAINRSNDEHDGMYCEEYAFKYGAPTNGLRYQLVEIRYTGVRHTEYENDVASRLRYDLRRGFEN